MGQCPTTLMAHVLISLYNTHGLSCSVTFVIMTPWDNDLQNHKMHHSNSIHFEIFVTTVIHSYILLLVFPTVVGIL